MQIIFPDDIPADGRKYLLVNTTPVGQLPMIVIRDNGSITHIEGGVLGKPSDGWGHWMAIAVDEIITEAK